MIRAKTSVWRSVARPARGPKKPRTTRACTQPKRSLPRSRKGLDLISARAAAFRPPGPLLLLYAPRTARPVPWPIWRGREGNPAAAARGRGARRAGAAAPSSASNPSWLPLDDPVSFLVCWGPAVLSGHLSQPMGWMSYPLRPSRLRVRAKPSPRRRRGF